MCRRHSEGSQEASNLIRGLEPHCSLIVFKESPHRDTRSPDSSDYRLELHARLGTSTQGLSPAFFGRRVTRDRDGALFVPLAIIRDHSLPLLHPKYPLYPETALVKRAWLLGVQVPCLQAIRPIMSMYLSTSEADGSQRRSPSRDSTRKLAIDPEARDVITHSVLRHRDHLRAYVVDHVVPVKCQC